MKTLLSLIIMFLIYGGQTCYAEDPSLHPAKIIIQNSTAKTFLQSIYANYYKEGTGVNIDKLHLITPALSQLIYLDDTLTTDGPPYLQSDLICDCQDNDGIKVSSMIIHSINSTHATATVSFKLFDKPKVLKFSLLKINGLWHIDDVKNKAEKLSIRAQLEQDIKALKSQK